MIRLQEKSKENNYFFYKGDRMHHTKQTTYILGLLFLSLSPHLCADHKNTVIATMNTGVTPAGIAITPSGHKAYVANNNNYGIDGEDSVTVLNLKNNTVRTTIFDESFNQPYTVSINPAGTRAYVTNSNSTTITVIDTSTNEVIDVIDGFDGPSGMAITSDGLIGYVNNYGGPEGVHSGNGTTVRVVDLTFNTIIGDPITVGQAPAAIAISPNGRFVYTVNYVDGNPGTGTLSVIRTSTNTVTATVNGFSGPFDIAITPNGKYAYVTNFGSNNFAPFGTTVSIVSLCGLDIIKTIEVGIQPAGVAITPDGHRAYVTNYNTLYAGSNFTDLTAGQGTVNIIDTHKKRVIPPTIAVDQSPANIAIASDGKHAYVTNFTSNTVNVIKLKD